MPKRTQRTPVRQHLPETRRGVTHKFEVAGTEGYLRTGEFDDGSLGEIFIDIAKQGSTLSGVMDSLAIMTSMALQYGVPLYDMVKKFSYARYEPSGFTSNPDIRTAYSLTDYMFRWLGLTYLSHKEQDELNLLPHDINTPYYHYEATSVACSHEWSSGTEGAVCKKCGQPRVI